MTVCYIKWARPTHRTAATEGEVDSHNARCTTESWRGPQRGLQLQRATSTRTVGGLRHGMGETYREDSGYRGRGRLAQGMVYYIEWARPAERTPATEGEVDSHRGRSIASKRRNLQRGLQLQKGRSTRTVDGVLHEAVQTYREDSSYRRGGPLAQWMVSYIEWARPTARTPATEDEVHSRSGWFTT